MNEPTPTPADVAEAERLFNENATPACSLHDDAKAIDWRFTGQLAALLARARAAEERANELREQIAVAEEFIKWLDCGYCFVDGPEPEAGLKQQAINENRQQRLRDARVKWQALAAGGGEGKDGH